jgi:DNA invertase Pin-like site-specific DNA recombinase
MKVANIEFENEEQLHALKAFAKAMKMRFVGLADTSGKIEKQQMLDSIKQGYLESLAIEKGEIIPKTIDQLLDEL